MAATKHKAGLSDAPARGCSGEIGKYGREREKFDGPVQEHVAGVVMPAGVQIARIASASSSATRAQTAVVDRDNPDPTECRSSSLGMTSSGRNHRNPI
jgi:hypothetical protein